MRRALMLPLEERWPASTHLDLAERAADAGIDAVLAGEVNGPEPFTLLGAVAARCPGVRVGTGIIPVAGRSPAVVAMSMATLADLAPAGVMAGFGSGTPLVVEQWHGGSFAQPVERMRRFVGAFRSAIGPSRADGAFHVAGRGAQVPVMLGAVGPKMLHLAGEIADDVFLTLCPADEVQPRLRHVRLGEAAAGRPEGAVGAVVLAFASDGTDATDARDRMRSLLARYASLDTHRPALARAGIDATAPSGEIDDGAVDRFLAVGTDGIASRMRELAEAGVDVAAVVPLPGVRGDLEAAARVIEMCLEAS